MEGIRTDWPFANHIMFVCTVAVFRSFHFFALIVKLNIPEMASHFIYSGW